MVSVKISKYLDILVSFLCAIRPASEQRGPRGVATGTPSHSNEHAAVMQRRPRCNAAGPLRQTAGIAVAKPLCVSRSVIATYENRSKITNFGPKGRFFGITQILQAFCQNNSEFLTLCERECHSTWLIRHLEIWLQFSTPRRKATKMAQSAHTEDHKGMTDVMRCDFFVALRLCVEN